MYTYTAKLFPTSLRTFLKGMNPLKDFSPLKVQRAFQGLLDLCHNESRFIITVNSDQTSLNKTEDMLRTSLTKKIKIPSIISRCDLVRVQSYSIYNLYDIVYITHIN